MKIVRMNTSSFWKGEAGVKGLVEDQGETFEVNLYLGSGRVRDYSCSCSKGNSYRGMCAHGEALLRIIISRGRRRPNQRFIHPPRFTP